MSNTIHEDFDLEESKTRPPLIKIRYIQVALLFLLLAIAFSTRICLSVAIVAMTTNNTSSNPNVPYYTWSNSNIILSSFFWSYAILQFFAGNLGRLFGIKNMLLIAVFVNALASCLIPVAAEYLGSNGVMALRVIQGLFQGFILPGSSAVLGRWLPPDELSFLNSIVFSGVNTGIILSMVVTGYLSASSYGWPAAFYYFGALGFIWCIFWAIFSAETPAKHSRITAEERKYIEQSLGQQNDHLIDKKSIPWKAILNSLPFWAVIMGAIGESWAHTFLSAELPSYLSYAVGFKIEDSSLFSAAPTVGALVGSLCYGPIAGLTIEKGWVSKVNSRRIFHGFSIFSLSIGMIILSYIENKAAIASILIVSETAAAAVTCGHMVNLIDLSPRYAGILSGISNGTGQMIAIFAPILVHFIVTNEEDKTLWRYTFILAAVIGISTAIFFIRFCSGERQLWDDVDKKRMETAAKNNFHGETNQAYQNDLVK